MGGVLSISATERLRFVPVSPDGAGADFLLASPGLFASPGLWAPSVLILLGVMPISAITDGEPTVLRPAFLAGRPLGAGVVLRCRFAEAGIPSSSPILFVPRARAGAPVRAGDSAGGSFLIDGGERAPSLIGLMSSGRGRIGDPGERGGIAFFHGVAEPGVSRDNCGRLLGSWVGARGRGGERLLDGVASAERICWADRGGGGGTGVGGVVIGGATDTADGGADGGADSIVDGAAAEGAVTEGAVTAGAAGGEETAKGGAIEEVVWGAAEGAAGGVVALGAAVGGVGVEVAGGAVEAEGAAAEAVGGASVLADGDVADGTVFGGEGVGGAAGGMAEGASEGAVKGVVTGGVGGGIDRTVVEEPAVGRGGARGTGGVIGGAGGPAVKGVAVTGAAVEGEDDVRGATDEGAGNARAGGAAEAAGEACDGGAGLLIWN